MDIVANGCCKSVQQSKKREAIGGTRIDASPSCQMLESRPPDKTEGAGESKKSDGIECISLNDAASISSDDLVCELEFFPPRKCDAKRSSRSCAVSRKDCGGAPRSSSRWQEIEPDSEGDAEDVVTAEKVGAKTQRFEPGKGVVARRNVDDDSKSSVQKAADIAIELVSNSIRTWTTPASPFKATLKGSQAARSTEPITIEEAASDEDKKEGSNDNEEHDKGEAEDSMKEDREDDKKESNDDDKKESGKDSDFDDDVNEGGNKTERMKEIKKKMAIRKLSFLTEKLNSKIKGLEEHELSLDDMKGDSIYTQLELYKKKLVQAWKKLCELKSQPTTTGRDVEKPFIFKGTNYPHVNKAISKFINRYQTFPDYQDINDIVSTCNDFFKLKLNKQMLNSISLSAFTSVGKALKGRRIRDYRENAGSHLTDRLESDRDPASEDTELRKKLEENRRKAEQNLEKTFHHFESMPAMNDEGSSDSDEEDDEEDDGAVLEEDEEEGRVSPSTMVVESPEESDVGEEATVLGQESKREEASSSSVEINAMELDSSDCEGLGGRPEDIKKSLSVQYDARQSLLEISSSSECAESTSIVHCLRSRNATRRGSNASSNPSTRSLRSSSSLAGPVARRVGESSKPIKRKAAIGPKCSKRQKVEEENPLPTTPRPTFVRLVDKISSFKVSISNPFLISKALTPSKVVLKNCMSCRVICHKSPGTSGEPAKAAMISDVPIRKKKSACAKSLGFDADDLKDAGQEQPATSDQKPGESKKLTEATMPLSESLAGPCEAVLSLSHPKGEGSASQACNTSDPKTVAYCNVVGEVLAYQGYDDGDISKEDEGLVGSVGSLKRTDPVIGPARHEDSENPSMESASYHEVVDLEEVDPRNEDGIIFVGTSPATLDAGSLANGMNPSRSDPNCSGIWPPPLLRSPRDGSLVKTTGVDSNASPIPHQKCGPSIATGPLIPLKSIGAYSGNGRGGGGRGSSRLMSRLLDPLVVTNDVRPPKLPAKVARKIDNMTKQITGAFRGRGRGLRTRPYQRPHPRPAFMAGQVFAAAMSNATARMSKAKKIGRHNGRRTAPSNFDATTDLSFDPSRASWSYHEVNYCRPPLHGSICVPPRLTELNGQHPEVGFMETVVIDDDDSLPHFADHKQQASIHAMPRRKPKNPLVPNYEQRVLQQKTKSSDSDVILCSVDFDPELFMHTDQENSSGCVGAELVTMASRGGHEGGQGSSLVNASSSVTIQEDCISWASSKQPDGTALGLTVRSLRIKTISSDSDVILCEDGIESYEGNVVKSPQPLSKEVHSPVPSCPPSSTGQDVGARDPSTISSQQSARLDSIPENQPPDNGVQEGSTDAIILLD